MTHDEQRFISVYRANVHKLYGRVYGWTSGDQALTEDIVQEAFLRAVRHWPSRGYPEDELAWLNTVARNLLMSYFRRKHTGSLEQVAKEPAVAPSDIERTERVDATRKALAAVRSGSLVSAFHLEGRPVREIAEQTGLSERAVEGRIHRARKALRSILAPFGPKETKR